MRKDLLFWIRLPLAGILNTLSNKGRAALNAGADVGDAITEWLAQAAYGSGDRLPNSTGRGTHDASDCVGQATNSVTEGGGDDFAGSYNARVVLLGVHYGGDGELMDLRLVSKVSITTSLIIDD